MKKYKVLLSDKVYIEEEVEANNLEEAKKKAIKEFGGCVIQDYETGGDIECYELNEWEADLLPREKYYFVLESITDPDTDEEVKF
jgi:hypothetical protein